ncbi:MAG TPA: prolipoprotein diacylglyceryl transferase [Firmicutes bacterium]|nr:prolipoprotein diacylglyceryl transferase [Bacillota bacterium]
MNIDPVAFSIGPIDIYWYGILISTGVLAATFLAVREAQRQGINEDYPILFLFWALPLGLLGARLWYVVFNWSYYSQNPGQILAFRSGGLAIHGAVIAGVLTLFFFCRAKKLDAWHFGDILAPGLILAQAIGRWGNFFNQEAYGVETDLPWAMYIDGAYRHPTFLYESLWDIMVFILLMRLLRQKPVPGEVMIKYFIFYSIGRFFIEGLRTDSLYVGPFRTAQVVSAFFVIAGLILLWYRKKEAQR